MSDDAKAWPGACPNSSDSNLGARRGRMHKTLAIALDMVQASADRWVCTDIFGLGQWLNDAQQSGVADRYFSGALAMVQMRDTVLKALGPPSNVLMQVGLSVPQIVAVQAAYERDPRALYDRLTTAIFERSVVQIEGITFDLT